MSYFRASTQYYCQIVLASSLRLLLLLFLIGECSSADSNATEACHRSFAICLEATKTLQLPENSIPSSAEEIKDTCDRFTGGMNCVNQYLDRCANNSVRALIEREINGAKRFFQHLCGSKKFQENYLYHASCIQTTRTDWNECIRRYRTIIQQEIVEDTEEPRTAVSKSLHYCCAQRAYEKCVLNSAKFKCPPESVLFIRDVLSMESQINCVAWNNRHKGDACRSGGALSFNLNANFVIQPVVIVAVFVSRLLKN